MFNNFKKILKYQRLIVSIVKYNILNNLIKNYIVFLKYTEIE